MTPQKSRPAGATYATTRSNDTPIDRVLHRLDKVKRTAPDKWIACCPAHDDKRPSLSVKQADDGKVLLICRSGCGVAEIVGALNLEMSDLFPGDRRSLKDHGTGPMRRPFDYRDCLTGIAHEATVARLIIEAVNRGEAMDAESLDRLALAEERIDDALRAAGGVQ
ncbi:hypothetical protein [Acidithiobacillus ferrianus]|uniref:hypothetical protein n=1 Tax=Acidithiobacillus ferrianus TaxID=2678518 RepID=UPI0034E3DB16